MRRVASTTVGYARSTVLVEFEDPTDATEMISIKQTTGDLRLNIGFQVGF